MGTYQILGTPTRRVDSAAKATGQARYAADVSLPGTPWGTSLHEPSHGLWDEASGEAATQARIGNLQRRIA
jgi:hypothetical protein